MKTDVRRRNVEMDKNVYNVTVALQSVVRHCNARVLLLMESGGESEGSRVDI